MAEQSAGARALAWDVLRRVDETDAFADALLGHRLRHSHLDRRDHALSTHLVYGTLAWRGFLDHAIEVFARRPSSGIDPPIRALLELALFQLFKLERVPSYAVVNSAVELAKTHRGGRAAGFVNAVLRRASALGERGVPLPDRAVDVAAHLALRHSHPRWLVDRWLREHGEAETEALLAANNAPAPTSLRVNRLRATPADVLARLRSGGHQAEASAVAPDAVLLAGGSPLDLEEVGAGLVTVQSEASQLVASMLDPRPSERILDACAGSGGKTTYIAERQGGLGSVVALDLHRHSLQRLRDESRRLGLTSIAPVRADFRRPPLAPGPLFERILLDAPCSGLGTLRQHPEIRWRRSDADIRASAAVQAEMLSVAFDLLRPGGVLVFAVCTLAREENDGVVDEVLARRADVVREMRRDALPPAVRDLAGEDGVLRTAPHRGGLDGFFAVRLKRL